MKNNATQIYNKFKVRNCVFVDNAKVKVLWKCIKIIICLFRFKKTVGTSLIKIKERKSMAALQEDLCSIIFHIL
jgi:hypothetical protein